MGRMTRNAILGLAVVAVVVGPCMAQVADDHTVFWNEAAQSVVLNRSELAKLGEALPAWQIRQMVWPSSEELRSAGVAVGDDLKDRCVTWLAKFVNAKQLPMNMKEHLIAMKAWGLVKPEAEQKRLCDVFIARFRKGGYTAQLQESPANVVMTIAQENPSPDANTDHRNLVFRTAALFLKEELRPNPDSKGLHVIRAEKAGVAITTVTWWIDSVMVEGPGNRTAYDGTKAAELGTWNVVSETDGRYVRFIIHKKIRGPVAPDVYAQRFSTPK
jgi:hypothetical protein